MKTTLALFLAVALLAAPASAELRAGAAVADITPQEWPIYLRGSFSKIPADGANDPLHTRAIVLENGGTKAVIAVVDSCMVGRDNLDAAKKKASAATGIPVENMLISATHTHSAPYDFVKWGEAPEKAYVKRLVAGIAKAVIDANANLQPAEIGFASHDEPSQVFNRRWYLEDGAMPANPFGETTDKAKMNPGAGNANLVKPAGPVDPEVYVLSVRTAKGRPLALLGNYSLHYVGRTPEGKVSADYFGEFARLIENRVSSHKPEPGFVGILSNGTSGDVNNINFTNPRPNRETFEQIRLVAADVADAAYYAYRDIKHSTAPILAMRERDITIDRRIPSEQQIQRARLTLEIAEEKGEKDLPRLAVAYAQRVLDHAVDCEKDPTLDIRLQVLRIGDLVINSIPFETFAEIGLELKEKSPFPHSFTIELANGGEGYLPTPEQHALGGYETWLTTNKVQLDASEIITANLLEMQNELR